MNSKIFISYGKEDCEVARRIRADLESSGLEIWIDEEELLGGQDWKLEIRRAIGSAQVMLILLSNSSASRRGYVHKEVRVALEILEQLPEGRIFVIPVRLEECTLGHSQLEALQWIDLFPDYGVGLERLERSIQRAVVRHSGETESSKSVNRAHQLEITADLAELNVWHGEDRDGIHALDLIRVGLVKPSFAYVTVKNEGTRNVDNLVYECKVNGKVEKGLGRWMVEDTGQFLDYEADGISLKVGVERILLLAVAYGKDYGRRWFRLEPHMPKRYYTDPGQLLSLGRSFELEDLKIDARLRAERVEERAELEIGFDAGGMPTLSGNDSGAQE